MWFRLKDILLNWFLFIFFLYSFFLSHSIFISFLVINLIFEIIHKHLHIKILPINLILYPCTILYRSNIFESFMKIFQNILDFLLKYWVFESFYFEELLFGNKKKSEGLADFWYFVGIFHVIGAGLNGCTYDFNTRSWVFVEILDQDGVL